MLLQLTQGGKVTTRNTEKCSKTLAEMNSYKIQVGRSKAKSKQIFAQMGGPHCTMDDILASHPAAPGSNPGVPKKFS